MIADVLSISTVYNVKAKSLFNGISTTGGFSSHADTSTMIELRNR
jgi:hypothetical protein